MWLLIPAAQDYGALPGGLPGPEDGVLHVPILALSSTAPADDLAAVIDRGWCAHSAARELRQGGHLAVLPD